MNVYSELHEFIDCGGERRGGEVKGSMSWAALRCANVMELWSGGEVEGRERVCGEALRKGRG